jgi:hypothetical protein
MAYTPDSNITTWVDSETVSSNLNFLAPSQFVFTMNSIRDVAYTCQTANIPNVTLGSSPIATRLSDVHMPGDTVTYGELIITFLVDEDMVNYKSLHDWIRKVGTAVDTAEYDEYIRNQRARRSELEGVKPVPIAPTMTDATLSIMNNNNVANIEIRFNDLFPISLEALQFDITDTSVPYLTAAATFQYKNYDIVKL